MTAEGQRRSELRGQIFNHDILTINYVALRAVSMPGTGRFLSHCSCISNPESSISNPL
jgi:hypothetical protein